MRVLLVWNGTANPAEADPSRRRRVPLMAALVRRGIHVSVALLDDRGGLQDHLRDAGVDVITLATRVPPSARAIPALLPAIVAIRETIDRVRPDVIDVSEAMPAIAVGCAALGRRRPLFYRRHHPEGWRWQLLWASRAAAFLATRTVVSNPVMQTCAAAQDGTPLDRIDITPSGLPEPEPVPPGVVDALRQRLGLASSTRVVLGLGRLRWEKGFDLLVEAAARLSPWPDVRVVIVGDGPEGATLRQRAARIDPPVLMPGHMADVQPWLALASLVVMPSRRESFGQVTLETMATGLPLVATAVGGLQDVVVDGVTGLLVPPDDPQAMADAVRALLVDPERATTLGAAARRRYSERYTIEHMADGWMAAWQRQLRSHEVAA